MEWFIPSTFVLLLAAVVFFLVLPKFAPYVLGSLAIILFIFGAWQHYSMFPYEYRGTILQELLSDYSPFIMLIAIIFGGMVAMMLAFGVSPPAVLDVIPEILPANNSKSANGGIMNVFKANNSNASNGNIMNVFKSNNSKANNGGIMNMIKPVNTKKSNIASTSFMTV
jgi:hypothetical protein